MRLLYTSFGARARVQVFATEEFEFVLGVEQFMVKSELRHVDAFHKDQYFSHLPLAIAVANQVSDEN